LGFRSVQYRIISKNYENTILSKRIGGRKEGYWEILKH
jgi:hypothetical protein